MPQSNNSSTNSPTNSLNTGHNSHISSNNSLTSTVKTQNAPTNTPNYLATTSLANMPLKTESNLPPFPPLSPGNTLTFSPNSLLNNTLPQPINGVLPRPPMPFQAHLQLVTSALMLLNSLEKNNPEFAKVYAHHLGLVKQAKTTSELEKYYFLIFALKYREQHKEENILPELVSKLTFMANNTDSKLPDCIDTTGGVVFDEFWGSGNLVSGRPLGRWVACWEHNGRYFRRGFPVALFGYNGAKELAESYWVERKRAIQLSTHNMDVEPVKVKKIKVQNRVPKQQPNKISEDSGDLLRFDQTNGKWYFESLDGKQYFNTQQEAIEAFRAMRIKVLKSYTECQMPGVNFEKNRICWCVSHWVPSKKVRRNRYFNINKYGWKRAKSLAITYKQLVDKMEGEEPSEKMVFEQADPNNTMPNFIIAILEEIRYKPMSLSEDRRSDKLSSAAITSSGTTPIPMVENISDELVSRSSNIEPKVQTTQQIHGIGSPKSTHAPSHTPFVSNFQLPISPDTAPSVAGSTLLSSSPKSQSLPQPHPNFQTMYLPYQQQLHTQIPHQNSQFVNANPNMITKHTVTTNASAGGKPSIKFVQKGTLPHEGEWEVTWTYGGNEMNRKFSTYHMGPEDAKNMAFIFLSQLQSQHSSTHIHCPQH